METNSTALILQPVAPEIPDRQTAVAETAVGIVLAGRAAIVRPSTETTDDEMIANAAIRIRNLWGQVNAVEKFIAIGGEFRELRDQLIKRSRYDTKRSCRRRAFGGTEGRSPFRCAR